MNRLLATICLMGVMLSGCSRGDYTVPGEFHVTNFNLKDGTPCVWVSRGDSGRGGPSCDFGYKDRK